MGGGGLHSRKFVHSHTILPTRLSRDSANFALAETVHYVYLGFRGLRHLVDRAMGSTSTSIKPLGVREWIMFDVLLTIDAY